MEKEMVDIVLVRPNAKKKLYQDLDSFNLTAIEPPLWAALMASYMRFYGGLEPKIIDAELENLSPADTALRIIDENPFYAIIVVSGSNPSVSTMQMLGVKPIVELSKTT